MLGHERPIKLILKFRCTKSGHTIIHSIYASSSSSAISLRRVRKRKTMGQKKRDGLLEIHSLCTKRQLAGKFARARRLYVPLVLSSAYQRVQRRRLLSVPLRFLVLLLAVLAWSYPKPSSLQYRAKALYWGLALRIDRGGCAL